MSQKLENQLNLALETPESVREQTGDLSVGFDPEDKTWELIIKYHGSEGELMRSLGTEMAVEPLIGGFAIVTVPERAVEKLSENPLIEYVEKPKNFYYSQEGPSARACIASVTARDPFLSGAGVLLAVIDSGIAYARPEFRKPDGRTRILYFWDQTIEGLAGVPGPPEGFREGAEFTEEWINETLRLPSEAARFERMPTIDVTGHGTAVAGIAAASTTGDYQGVAPGCELIIVKLGGGNGDLAGYSKTTEILRAVTYCLRKAWELGKPLVVNLSFGNTYGAHDGSSLLERFLDQGARTGRTVICVGSGNEGNGAGHVAGNVAERKRAELAVAGFERHLSVQFWKHYSDKYRVYLRAPGGTTVELTPQRQDEEGGGYVLRVENTRILAYFGEPTPYSVNQELYLEMLPGTDRDFLPEGIWTFTLEPVRIVTGDYCLYLPPAVTRNGGTGFLEPTPYATLTIPSAAEKVITVGAYDPAFDAYADFSGRGYLGTGASGGGWWPGAVKPDVVAPGVNLLAPDVFGGFSAVTGTSFATPIVSGSAALLMEWGIVRGRDPYLYGEKVKAYLRGGARPIRGETLYPNAKVGYGASCVADAIPVD